MIIRDKPPIGVTSPYTKRVQGTDVPQRDAASSSAKGAPQVDEVAISAQAVALQKAKDAGAPDEEVRSDKVALLRQRIQSGEYQVQPDKLAGRLMGDA